MFNITSQSKLRNIHIKTLAIYKKNVGFYDQLYYKVERLPLNYKANQSYISYR